MGRKYQIYLYFVLCVCAAFSYSQFDRDKRRCRPCVPESVLNLWDLPHVSPGRSVIYRHMCGQMYIVDLTHVQSYSFQVPQHADTVELKHADWETSQGEHAGPLYFQKERNSLLLSGMIQSNHVVQSLFWCLGMCDFVNVFHASCSFFYNLLFKCRGKYSSFIWWFVCFV